MLQLVSERASVGLVSRWGGTDSDDFEGACPVEKKPFLKNFVIGAFVQSF